MGSAPNAADIRDRQKTRGDVPQTLATIDKGYSMMVHVQTAKITPEHLRMELLAFPKSATL